MNNKLPHSLKNIIVEKESNLRHRTFEYGRTSKDNSINKRLAKRAKAVVGNITHVRTKKKLMADFKDKVIREKYSFTCVRRNCFICSPRRAV